MKVCLLALSLCCSVTALADLPYAALTGRVTSDGRPAAGALVTATCDALPQARTTTTIADGSYWLAALPPGPCSVTFSHAGMQTLTRSAELHAGELVRSDASLAPSADEEAVTSTATSRSVFERPYAVWSLDAATIAQLPSPRGGEGPLRYAPILNVDTNRVDGIVNRDLSRLGALDAVQEVTSIPTSAPLELGSTGGGTLAIVTKSGGEFHASVRATWMRMTGGDDEMKTEGTAGGSLGESLYLFGAAASGDDPAIAEPRHSAFAKGTASFGAVSTAIASVVYGRGDTDAALDWLLVVNDRVTATAAASSGGNLSAKGFALFGAHQLAAGVTRISDTDGVFVSDRWSIAPRWVIDAGVRAGEGSGFARAGAAFDVSGDGRRRVAANASHSQGESSFELWYGQQVEANGYARAGVVRRDGTFDTTALIVDASFRFLILTVGGNAVLAQKRPDEANAWVIVDAPLLERDLNLALVGRLRGGWTAVDAAVSFSMPVLRVEPFVKLEVTNAFDRDLPEVTLRDVEPRTFRFGLGVRL